MMGLAHVAAACDPAKAACINEDSGLLLGIVVAHEVGHVYCIHHAFQSQLCVCKVSLKNDISVKFLKNLGKYSENF